MTISVTVARGASVPPGFTLVELAAATAIFAAVLIVAVQVLGDGALRQDRAMAQRAALLLARSCLDQVGVDLPLAPGANEGRSGALAWRVTIEDDAVRPPRGAPALLRVEVTVGRIGDAVPLVALTTLRLAVR